MLIFYQFGYSQSIIDVGQSQIYKAQRALNLTAENIGLALSENDCSQESVLKKLSEDPAFTNQRTCRIASEGYAEASSFQLESSKIYAELSVIEIANLQCSEDLWGNLVNKKEEKEIIAAKIKKQLPLIDDLNQQMIKLLQKSSQEKLTISNSRVRRSRNNSSPISVEQIASEIKDLNEFTQKQFHFLKTQYDLELAKIPLTQHAEFRSFIESHLTSSTQKLKQLESGKLESSIIEVRDRFKKKKQSYQKSLLLKSYNPDQETELITSQDLVNRYLNQMPEARFSVRQIQCRESMKQSGYEKAELATNAMAFLPIGFLAKAAFMTKGVAAAVAAKRTEHALNLAGRIKNYTSLPMLIGTSSAALPAVYNHCARYIDKSKPACDVSKDSIENDEKFTNCLMSASMMAVPGLGRVAQTVGDKLVQPFKETLVFQERSREFKVRREKGQGLLVTEITDEEELRKFFPKSAPVAPKQTSTAVQQELFPDLPGGPKDMDLVPLETSKLKSTSTVSGENEIANKKYRKLEVQQELFPGEKAQRTISASLSDVKVTELNEMGIRATRHYNLSSKPTDSLYNGVVYKAEIKEAGNPTIIKYLTESELRKIGIQIPKD